VDRNRRIVVALLAIVVVTAVVLLTRGGSDNGQPGAAGQTTTTSNTAEENADRTTSTTAADSPTTDPTSSTTVLGTTEGESGDPGGEAPPDTLPDATDPDAGNSRQTPVPLGTAIEVGLWNIGVSGADLDAVETITEFVDFNPTPAEGNRFVLIELSGVYLGSGIVDPVFEWELVDLDGDRIEATEACGVVPESIYDLPGVDGGDNFRANICFEAGESDVAGGAFLTLGLVSESGSPYFFALD
jgi:hypothetical protein